VLALRAQYADATPPLQELEAIIDTRYLGTSGAVPSRR
jgi:hypothetical protein